MNRMLNRMLEIVPPTRFQALRCRLINRWLTATGSAFAAIVLLAGAASSAQAGEILFVSDSTTDSQNIPDLLSNGAGEIVHPTIPGAGLRPGNAAGFHDVIIIRNDFLVTGDVFGLAEGRNTALASLPLDDYCAVIWSASGPHEPDGLGAGLGADGGLHTDLSVFTNLNNYVADGGFVLVTGHDAVANPYDEFLTEFVGGSDAASGQTFYPLLTQPAGDNALTVGPYDISSAGVGGGGINPVDGVPEQDYLVMYDANTSVVVVDTTAGVFAPDGPAASWAVRHPYGPANEFINNGHIAYIANGIFLYEDLPSRPGVFLSDGEDAGWLTSPAYRGALGNFAFNSCISLPFDAGETPVADDQFVSTPQDTPVAIVLAGSDPNDDPLTFEIDVIPTNGALGGAPPNVTYTPNVSYSGPDQFTFRVSDGERTSDPGIVTIDVLPNTPPVANDDSYPTDEDTPLIVPAPGVLGNDTDDDGDALNAALVTGPTNGSLTFSADGSFDYGPFADFCGVDRFTYRANDGAADSNIAAVTLNVTCVNDPPVATDDSYTTDEDVTLSVAAPGVLANDTDVEGDALIVSLVSGPSDGTLILNSNGSFIYTPNLNFNGTDSFIYAANDGNGLSDSATVTITVRPVNDPPAANDDAYTTDEDVMLSVAAPGVLANDSDVDGDPLTAALLSGPVNGSLTLNADGSFTYMPNLNFNGTDSFDYEAGDGNGAADNATVTITVRPVNDPPVATDDSYTTDEDVTLSVAAPGVLSNDTDVEGDPLTASLVSGPSAGSLTLNADGSFIYTPDLNFNGTDTFIYEAGDGNGAADSATVTITVRPVNDPPVAADDSYGTLEDIPLNVAAPGVLANDSDVDGDPLTTVPVTGPGNGSLTLNADGSFSYAPFLHFCGVDTFTYVANDGVLDSNTATVTLDVACVNDPPVGVDDAYTTDEDTLLNVSVPGVLANDSDVDSMALTAVLVTGPGEGTLTLNPDGSFTYMPNADYYGGDSFTYVANDGEADSNVATVSITINAVNDAPVIQQVSPLVQTVDYSDNITDVTITATDVDSPVLTLTDVGTPALLSISESCVLDNTVPAGTGGSCSWTLSGVVDVPKSMRTVDFTVTDGEWTDTASTNINVEAEDATATLDEDNDVALEVASEGGNSGPFSLTVFTRETLPDNAEAGPAAPGDITKAVVTIQLEPVGPGSPISGTCSSTPMGTTGYDKYLKTVCSFDNVPVNTYSTVANVNVAGYYMGGDEDALTIFDPSLGFTTGGGWFYWPGTDDRTNFGYTMKYGKNGRNVKGNLLLIRRTDTGKYRIKSNALEGLAIGEGGTATQPFGWATFSGKATYIQPGWLDAVGNYEFTTYVEDRDEPGMDVDRFWIEVRDKKRNVVPDLSMDEPADVNAEPISGGNIVVPHNNGNGNGNGKK